MLEEFKEFVKTKPELAHYVSSNEMTWQKFYELYNLYGKDHEIWNNYTGVKETIGLTDVIAWFKQINLDSLSENIDNVQKVVELLQDFKTKDTPYKPRPIYKHFED